MSRYQQLIEDALSSSKVLGATQRQHAPKGRARAHQPGEDGLNKTERQYAAHLELLRSAGEIRSFKVHALKLRLAKATFFDTDFLVVAKDGTLEIHETKGYMEDDAAVKLKVAAGAFPFLFKLVKKDGDGWRTTIINP